MVDEEDGPNDGEIGHPPKEVAEAEAKASEHGGTVRQEESREKRGERRDERRETRTGVS
jgi:hypothetical protein